MLTSPLADSHRPSSPCQFTKWTQSLLPLYHTPTRSLSDTFWSPPERSVAYVTDAKCCGVSRLLCLRCPSLHFKALSITVVWICKALLLCNDPTVLCVLHYCISLNILTRYVIRTLIKPSGRFPNLLGRAEQIRMHLNQ